MNQMPNLSPCRITDLVELKKQGADVTCQTTFEILPVEFDYRDNPFRAHIFLCIFTGAVNGEKYSFRKCYSRGCPNNLCPHVSQAVMIANRYLQRDYHRLEQAGIAVDKRLFSLEEMTVKFEELHEDPAQPMTIHDLIAVAKAGQAIRVEPALEWVSAVENFAHQHSKTIFLMANFRIDCQEKISRYERCLACYPAESDHEERLKKITIANQRLKLLYEEFEQAAIQCERRYF